MNNGIRVIIEDDESSPGYRVYIMDETAEPPTDCRVFRSHAQAKKHAQILAAQYECPSYDESDEGGD